MKEPWFWIVGEIGPPHIHDIQRAVAAAFPGVSLNDINSERRAPNVVRARHIAMYLSRLMTLHSLPVISRCFGGRDHSTTLKAARKITGLIAIDPVLAAKIESIRLGIAA